MTLQTLLFLLATALFLMAVIAAADLKSIPYLVLFTVATVLYAVYTILSFFGKV